MRDQHAQTALNYKACLYQWVFKKSDAKENSILIHDMYRKNNIPYLASASTLPFPCLQLHPSPPRGVPLVQSCVAVGWLHSSAWRRSRLFAHLVRGGLLKERAEKTTGFPYAIWKVDGATPKTWLSKGI